MNEEVKLMKGNDALAMAAIRYGADGYFGSVSYTHLTLPTKA